MQQLLVVSTAARMSVAETFTVVSHLDLALGILAYFFSSLGGVAVVKVLNYRFCFTSWLILALLS